MHVCMHPCLTRCSSYNKLSVEWYQPRGEPINFSPNSRKLSDMIDQRQSRSLCNFPHFCFQSLLFLYLKLALGTSPSPLARHLSLTLSFPYPIVAIIVVTVYYTWSPFQADETTRLISTIKKKIEQVQGGHNTMLTSFSNHGTMHTWFSQFLYYICSIFAAAAKESIDALNEEIKKLSHKVHAQLKSMFFTFVSMCMYMGH